MFRPFLFFLILLVFTGVACHSSKKTQQPAYEEGFNSSSFLKQINAVRASGCNCGGKKYPAAGPVSWNNALATVASGHSNYMQRAGALKHSGRNGAGPEKRVTAAGYKWSYVAENIAMGQRSTKEVIQNWLQSPGHCRNIMNPDVTEIGAGRSGPYWTLVLARPY